MTSLYVTLSLLYILELFRKHKAKMRKKIMLSAPESKSFCYYFEKVEMALENLTLSQ